MLRYTIAVVLMVCARTLWPCEDIAVLSNEGKYMLLDGHDLTTLDVGNLRWKRIFGVDAVLPGSTSRRFAFWTDQFHDEGHHQGRSRHHPPSALVVVEDLAERRPMHLSASREYDFSPEEGWWVDGTDELLVWQSRRSTLSLLDKRLTRIDEWTEQIDLPGAMIMACRDEDRLVIGVHDYRIVRDEGRSFREALATPEGAEDCGVERLSLGCFASMGCQRAGRYTKVILDIASNRVMSVMRFDAPALSGSTTKRSSGQEARISSARFFAGGRKLLRQLELWTPDGAGPNSYRMSAGPLIRALDTGTSDVVTENLEAPTGAVSRVFCAGRDERVVMSSEGQVDLVDLNTLQSIASAALPFRRYFVF